MLNINTSSTENRLRASLLSILKIQRIISMENKFNVKKVDCTQENSEFFTGSVGNTEINNSEYKNYATENGNVKNTQVAIGKEAERSH